jgi:hypothetical protein
MWAAISAYQASAATTAPGKVTPSVERAKAASCHIRKVY